MKFNQYKIRSQVWIYPGMAAWHFLSVPVEQAAMIKEEFGALKRGWGSLPVVVTIGKTTWKTSIFPDKKSGGYLLPLKAEIRKREKIVDGQVLDFLIEIILSNAV